MTTLNTWLDNSPEDYLRDLRDTSHARMFCRSEIVGQIARGARSITEVGVGGLNERIALDGILRVNPHVAYTGTDWTQTFVDRGAARYPQHRWRLHDIIRDPTTGLQADIVYTQHVLEHCPGLNPALFNLLSMAQRVLYVIFFIPPLRGELINWEAINWNQYPRYHNRYASEHIERVCAHHGFASTLRTFDNTGLTVAPQLETVLIATRL